MIGLLRRLLTGLTSLLSLPAAVAHEGTHATAGRVLADDAALSVSLFRAEAHAYVRGLDDVSGRAATVVCLAPTILGTWLAIVVFAWWVLAGYDLPEAVVGWAKLAIVGLVWGLYTMPSDQDLKRARHHASGGAGDAE